MPIAQTFNISGRGDMGSLVDRLVPPRFSLPISVYSLSALRVTFAGGSGSATLRLKVDHRSGPSFDRTVQEFAGVGTGGTGIEFRIDEDERDSFLFFFDSERLIRDELVLIWTDPDAGKLTTWAVSADLQGEIR